MSTCARCGATFACGMADLGATGAGTQAPCWCTQLPLLPRGDYALASPDNPARCFCPNCLRQLTATSSVSPEKTP